MKKIIILTNSDWHFYAHLLPIALKAKTEGYEVKLLTQVSKFQEQIEELAIKVLPITIKPNSINPFTDLLLLWKIIRILNQEKPDILHNFTIKPILYGSISSLWCKIPKTINNFVGMGTIFVSDNLIIKLLRLIIVKLIALIANYKQMLFIVQNNDDHALLVKSCNLRPSTIITQCSVGLDTSKFPALLEPVGEKIIFALVARMIIEKGIYEFIKAAKILRQKGLNAEFWLVGPLDKNNKRSINYRILEQYQTEGYIRYIGYQQNIEEIWKKSHVAVLPSYREGLSRSLLEAGAYGRAIITTDAPGGRALVQDRINGLLVAPQSAEELAKAMELLINEPTLRKSLGAKIRHDILTTYDSSLIATKMVKYYHSS
ncbi:glycosyltransferase family 4 protein [Candidatus Tisiphia endosymbiont of Beris chalybata]|uniref:glycosyltransferase family 4 protein n=1 Tax=Candidatus Tisiphia endosymbiont of Beris chalybata TaxID=3066262 RepID=UPI00312CA3F8